MIRGGYYEFRKNNLVLLALAVSLVAVQTGKAQATVTVAGTVYSVSVADSVIHVDEGDGTITTVNCIPFNRLAMKFKIVLEVGDQVSIGAHGRSFSDGTAKLVAVSLSAENESGEWVTVQLR